MPKVTRLSPTAMCANACELNRNLAAKRLIPCPKMPGLWLLSTYLWAIISMGRKLKLFSVHTLTLPATQSSTSQVPMWWTWGICSSRVFANVDHVMNRDVSSTRELQSTIESKWTFNAEVFGTFWEVQRRRALAPGLCWTVNKCQKAGLLVGPLAPLNSSFPNFIWQRLFFDERLRISWHSHLNYVVFLIFGNNTNSLIFLTRQSLLSEPFLRRPIEFSSMI